MSQNDEKIHKFKAVGQLYIALSEKGKVLAKFHMNEIPTDFYKAFGKIGISEIEKAIHEELQFKLDHPELF